MPHIHELIDYTSDVFVVYGNRVLLRLHDKYNLWLAVGGHIELNEDPNEAAVREAKEEVGLDIKLWDGLQQYHESGHGYRELIPPVFMNIHPIKDQHQHISFVYFATSETDAVTEPDGDERSGGWRWLTREEIEQSADIKPSIKHYALAALAAIGSDSPAQQPSAAN
jgi:ADP-ribose pyrophosphatase YjhB (NUDIX family)